MILLLFKTVILIAFACCIIQVYDYIKEIRLIDNDTIENRIINKNNRGIYKSDMKMFTILSLVLAIIHSIL